MSYLMKDSAGSRKKDISFTDVILIQILLLLLLILAIGIDCIFYDERINGILYNLKSAFEQGHSSLLHIS